MADPEKITMATPPPADFDEFWQGKLAEVKKIPANPQLEARLKAWRLAEAKRKGLPAFRILTDAYVSTNDGTRARGEPPCCVISILSGKSTGSWSSGTGTRPSRSQ